MRRSHFVQPQYPVNLDPNNEFGVTAFATVGYAATRSGIVVPTSSAGIGTAPHPQGVGYSAGAADEQVTFGRDGFQPTFPFTVMMGFAPSSDSAAAEFATSNEGVTNFAGWMLGATATAANFKLRLQLGSNTGTQNSGRRSFGHSVRISLASHVGGAVVRSITDADVILDGVLETPTSAFTGSAMAHAAADAGFGGRTTGAICAGRYDWLLVCDRALTLAEWDRLAANPWQVLLMEESRREYFAGAGGGPDFKPAWARNSNVVIQ